MAPDLPREKEEDTDFELDDEQPQEDIRKEKKRIKISPRKQKLEPWQIRFTKGAPRAFTENKPSSSSSSSSSSSIVKPKGSYLGKRGRRESSSPTEAGPKTAPNRQRSRSVLRMHGAVSSPSHPK
jgi:hypothetical protein